MKAAARRCRRLALAAGALLALWASGCGGEAPPSPTFGALGGDVAHVGDVSIPGSLVEQVARARGTTARLALGDVVDDALAAQGARAAGLDASPAVGWASTAALARGVSEQLQQAARSAGPPRDEELADVTVVHAVVLRSRALPEANALAIASGIRQAVAGAPTADVFQARASGVPHAHAVVKVESLPPFDAAGQSAAGTLDPAFVAAAFALKAPGDTSEVIESSFGWHVIRLVARTVPSADILAARRSELVDAVLAVRVRAAMDELLRARREREHCEILGPADELMALAAPREP